MMDMPAIRYYAVLEHDKGSKTKTPKYVVTRSVSYDSLFPMEALTRRDGRIYFYLQPTRGSKENAPEMYLEGKNSLNFTGLHQYFTEDGKLSGVAYGYPEEKPTYSKEAKPNPFYIFNRDGYLFVVHPDKENPNNVLPSKIELLVLVDCKPMVRTYCRMLQMGGFDETLRLAREQAGKYTI